MTLRISEYDEGMAAAVVEFTSRLRKDSGLRLAEDQFDHNVALNSADAPIYRKHYLVLDEQDTIHGVYILKHQRFWTGKEVIRIGCYGLPVSEGIVNQAYTPLGVWLLRDALRRQPLLVALGMGGFGERLPRLLQAAGWRLAAVPFYFRVIHPTSFLRNIVYLRRSALHRSLLDMAAASRVGWLGITAVQALRRPKACGAGVTAEEVCQFTDWTDEIWSSCNSLYALCAVRNRQALDILYPPACREFIRLKVCRDGRAIGWAVLLNSQLANHRHFGNMRLGSIVDCFAHPKDARAVIACSRQWLEAAGVDLIVSNQCHRDWCDALQASGFLRGPSNFLLGTSRELTALLDWKTEAIPDQFHVNRGDGDGPINL